MSDDGIAPKTIVELAPYVNVARGEAAQRLLTDLRMVEPWRAIEDRAKQCERAAGKEFHKRISQLAHLLHAKTWLDVPRSDWELAVCAIFLTIAIEAALQQPAARKKDIKDQAAPWRFGAELCKAACYSPHRASRDPELKRALELVSDYFDHWAEFIEDAATGPRVIERGTRKLGRLAADDNLRVRVRTISRQVAKLLGDDPPMHKTVKTISNVVFACDIHTKDVANWSKEFLRPG
jgi:hypothetical protein